MKQLITVVLLILFSVSIVYALDEQSRCGLGENCNFVWDVVNNSNKAQKIVSPCNVTVYNGTYIEIWSVLSQVTNTWHNVSIPTNTFGVGYYYAERLCNETISSFNFQINTTLSNLDALVNVSINGSIGEAVWTYNFSDSMTAMAYVEGNDMSFFAVAIFLTAALFLYLAFNLKGDYKILQILFLFLTICSGVPAATTVPPASPPSGPRSII